MILRQSILSTDKILKEIMEMWKRKNFLSSLAYSLSFLNVSVLSVYCRL